MKTKKRKKQTRLRGSHTQGGGFKKKQRGSGNRGGVGNAGTGKRADHKKKDPQLYFGKSKTLRRAPREEIKTMNLEQIQNKFQNQGQIDLSKFKILGKGQITFATKITSLAASKSAIEKVKKAGGEIILKEKKEMSQKKPK